MTLSLRHNPLSLWDDDFGGWAGTSASGLEVSEDETHVYVAAHVPGIDEKDIEITFDKGTLWIKGESSEAEEDKKRKYYRRSSSSFSYQVVVPGEVDQNRDPEAELNKGILTVKFNKTPQSQPKKITVKSGK